MTFVFKLATKWYTTLCIYAKPIVRNRVIYTGKKPTFLKGASETLNGVDNSKKIKLLLLSDN